MDLEQYRKRAADAIQRRIYSWGNAKAPQSDKEVDELARFILGLPERPEGDPPYAGWISESASESEVPSSDKLDWSNPNSRVSEFFTVKEVTQNDSRRVPSEGSEVEANVLALAKELDTVRRRWGSPIGVTSWYRPPMVNEEVGGAENSQHLTGRAADIYTVEGNPLEFEQILDQQLWKNRALGYGVESGKGFTHIDLRQGRIRWYY